MKPDDVNFVYHLKYDFDIAELNRIKDDTVKNEVNYRSVLQILGSWFITIPGGAVLAIMFFVILKNLFGVM